MNPQPPVIDPGAHEASVHTPHGRKKLAMLIGLILISVMLAALAQLTLKHGMNRVTASSGPLNPNAGSMRAVLATPAIWAGLMLFGLSAVVWLAVLSRASLSFAYPFVSITYVLILVADRFVLHEHISPLRWIGIALITAGVGFVAGGPALTEHPLGEAGKLVEKPHAAAVASGVES